MGHKTLWVVRAGVMGVLITGPWAMGENVLLHDFEQDIETWENEAPVPVAAMQTTEKAKHGNGSLSFYFHFTKATPTLQTRVLITEKDYSKVKGFQGFSAWVYIPKGGANWAAQMFVRSNDPWVWSAGKRYEHLQPGWHRVDILAKDIKNTALIQDLGVQVHNFIDDIETTVYIDLVETIVVDQK